jgi:hypothetical protein
VEMATKVMPGATTKAGRNNHHGFTMASSNTNVAYCRKSRGAQLL